VLRIAGYAMVFTHRQQSDAALRFVTLWNAVLHAMADGHMITIEQLPLLDTLATLLPRLLGPLASRMGRSLDVWRRTQKRDGLPAANQELLNQQLTMEGGYHRMLRSLHELAGLYSRMLHSIEALSFSKQQPLDGAAKELALRRLLPPSTADLDKIVEGGGIGAGKDAHGSALLAFLSALFFDVVLRLAEGWHAGAGGATRNDVERLTRQDCIGAIKHLVAGFCVIDEERRFELFQLTARLEARWGLTLPPALMNAIKTITEEELFKRALGPYLQRSLVLESDGETIFEAAWMVQEGPKKMKGPMVMVMVTNRAIYLLEPADKNVCTVCEPWKLCPAGPRLKYRLPFHRLNKIVLDFTTKYHCGHRMKLVCAQDVSETSYKRPAPSLPNGEHGESGGFSSFNPLNVCGACFGGAKNGDARNGKAVASKDAGALVKKGGGGSSAALTTSRSQRGEREMMELQFSTLHVGVVERLTKTIKRLMDPRPVDVVRDTHQLRALAMASINPDDEGGGSPHNGALVTFDPLSLGLHSPLFDCRFAVRCERLPDNWSSLSKAKKAKLTDLERLLVLSKTSISIFIEQPDVFHVPLAEDAEVLGGSEVARAGRSGSEMVKFETQIDLGALDQLELEMSDEPKVRLKGQDDKGNPNEMLLQFADDTAALLFRMHMRSVLWDKGRAEWKAHSLNKMAD